MNKCPKCGAETAGAFCPSCGSPVQAQPAPQPTPAPQPAPKPAPEPVRTAPVYNNYIQQKVMTEEDLPAKYRPVGTWGYFWLKLLYAVPIIGFIFLIIHTFSNGNINRRNHARSYWCAFLIGLVLMIIALIIMLIISLVLGVPFLELLRQSMSSTNY